MQWACRKWNPFPKPLFEPTRRVYQRLLAGDPEEATELVGENLGSKPLVEVYDTLLIPALALAETDWHRGELDEKHTTSFCRA